MMPATAQTVSQSVATDGTACGIGISDIAMKRNAELMTIGMNFDLGKFDLDGNHVAVFSPMIVKGADTLVLQPVGLYSRTRWYQYLRAGEKPLGGEGETTIRWSERPETMDYSQTVPYAEWMNGSQLYLRRSEYGCCRKLLLEWAEPLANYRELKYSPMFRYVRPVADATKTRELSGRAFVDFVVNRTEINPSYRNNVYELNKIISTIDSVRSDKDITVKRITIKGFASPEGSYANNIRLAKGRTESLKQYVRKLYHFSNDFISTDYEPEDWAGLRDYVVKSNIANRDGILAIIDSNLEPDPKNSKIQSTYPVQYAFLLKEVYPALRHSDYTIEYTIRTYNDINEIRQIMATAPQKLSLNEMFLLAQSYEPGSDEYNNVFDTAVRMYPNDETANVNAANSAMSRGDIVTATRYLSKAGNGNEAIYARGVLAALQGDNATAVQMFSQVEGKLPEASEALKTVKEILEYSGK
ncbi:MAG: hypothetical protein J1E57_03560 [Prevotella sp.]|nr:hypothetical protein [Prevotella sp.]